MLFQISLEDIICFDISCIGLSWFDFFSLGHICFGIGTFLFISLFYTIPKHKGDTPIFSLLFVFILTFIILIIWELLENILFVAIGLKFEGRSDSPQNIATDIILGVVGALVTWLICHEVFVKDKNIWDYYIFGLIGFFLWLIFFFIIRYFTYFYTGAP